MSTNQKAEVLDTKEKVFSELGIHSEQELSTLSVFRKLINLDKEIDKDVLGLILPNIKNFTELVSKQQEFIMGLAEKQKGIDEKALESFNKTKDIISEIIKSTPTMDKEIMIYLIDSLKEMDGLVSNLTSQSGMRIERIIKAGLAIGGTVAAAVFAIIFKGGGNSNKK